MYICVVECERVRVEWLQEAVACGSALGAVVAWLSRPVPQPYEDGKAAVGTTVLVVGGGPCGLRMAIECLLLGCRVLVVEKRTSYSRNNVLHLWPFTITDLKRLGAKKFYGKFCAGSLDHISEWAGIGCGY